MSQQDQDRPKETTLGTSQTLDFEEHLEVGLSLCRLSRNLDSLLGRGLVNLFVTNSLSIVVTAYASMTVLFSGSTSSSAVPGIFSLSNWILTLCFVGRLYAMSSCGQRLALVARKCKYESTAGHDALFTLGRSTCLIVQKVFPLGSAWKTSHWQQQSSLPHWTGLMMATKTTTSSLTSFDPDLWRRQSHPWSSSPFQGWRSPLALVPSSPTS